MRKTFEIFFSISFGTFLSFILLEVYGRILPASDVFPLEKPIECEYNKKLTINCFPRRKANKKFLKTIGKVPPVKLYARKKSNDIGQLTDINLYEFKKKSNLNNFIPIFSIGDSFVEAVQVDNKKTFHGLLNKEKIFFRNTNKKKGIISIAIGSSGRQLPTYIKYLEYAIDNSNFEKTFYLINVVSNDFDQSYEKYVNLDGFFYFSQFNKEIYLKESPKNNIFYNSFLFFLDYSKGLRFVFLNGEFKKVSSSLISRINCFLKEFSNNLTENECKNKNFLANVEELNYGDDSYRIDLSFKATDLFLEKLEKLIPDKKDRKRLIISVDADRLSIYDIGIPKSLFFENQRNYLIDEAKKLGFSVIDLDPIFRKHFNKNKNRFDYEFDNHWNELGHQLLSSNIIKIISRNINN